MKAVMFLDFSNFIYLSTFLTLVESLFLIHYFTTSTFRALEFLVALAFDVLSILKAKLTANLILAFYADMPWL